VFKKTKKDIFIIIMTATATTTTTTTSTTLTPSTNNEVMEVTVHPLVLLSAADHYHRVARGTRKRVVGVLLGQVSKGKVEAMNSFAVPFEEDSRNPVRCLYKCLCGCVCGCTSFIIIIIIIRERDSSQSLVFLLLLVCLWKTTNNKQAVFYLDHNYLENMLLMFRKVSSKERVVGFYSTGPSIRPNDLRIHKVVQPFAPTPAVFCIIDIRPNRPDLPVTAYKVTETVVGQEKKVQRNFTHVPILMGATEPEEIGVEHLLRDINDPTISTVASLIKNKLSGLATLTEKLLEAKDYLEAVLRGDRPYHAEIMANLQTIINLLPNLNQPNLVRAMMVKTNDMLAAIYIASVIRSVLALHDLINNKLRYGEDGEERKPATGVPNNNNKAVEEEKKEDDSSKKKTTTTTADKKKDKKK
jgi:26S proteasome regulatory subunit N8